jgi:hypothetical protein
MYVLTLLKIYRRARRVTLRPPRYNYANLFNSMHHLLQLL